VRLVPTASVQRDRNLLALSNFTVFDSSAELQEGYWSTGYHQVPRADRVSHYTPKSIPFFKKKIYGSNIGNHIATRNEEWKHCNSIEMSVNREIKRNKTVY